MKDGGSERERERGGEREREEKIGLRKRVVSSAWVEEISCE